MFSFEMNLHGSASLRTKEAIIALEPVYASNVRKRRTWKIGGQTEITDSKLPDDSFNNPDVNILMCPFLTAFLKMQMKLFRYKRVTSPANKKLLFRDIQVQLVQDLLNRLRDIRRPSGQPSWLADGSRHIVRFERNKA